MKEKLHLINDNLSSIFVIFGGTGDLTHRKLIPALYNLVRDKLIPEHFAIVSIGRRVMSLEEISGIFIHLSISTQEKKWMMLSGIN